ncbi:MAG: FGGY family carbohydrate kinase [Halanaerobiales bacterium]
MIKDLGTLMYDVKKEEWDIDSLDYIGLSKENFSDVISPDDVGGRISQEAANQLPLKKGTPIIVGASDTVMEVFGAGAIKNGQATIKLASVGSICVVSEAPVLDKRLLNYQHLINNKWYLGT